MPDGRPSSRRTLPRTVAGVTVALVLALAGPAAALAEEFRRDRTPLSPDAVSGDGGGAAQAAGGTGAALRLVLGLAVVLALIFVVRWTIRRARREPRPGGGGAEVTLLSTTPLGGTRAVHLLRVGEEVVLVGSAEHAVTPIRVYGPDEAAALLATLPEGSQPPVYFGSGGGAGLARLVDDLRRRSAR